jgi:alkaline phosphatase
MKRTMKSLVGLLLILAMSTGVVYANTHVVQPGDMLWKIAVDNGVSSEEIAEANNLSDPNMLIPGQSLVIPEGNQSPKYVIMLIGDGLGFSQRQITEYYEQKTTGTREKLAMNQLEIAGVNTTYSANSLITDSAAAGTALASGVKTNNGVIGKNADNQDVPTLVELAEEKGMATGIVTTTRLTHATPAAFATHNESRNNESAIAEDYLDSGVDFLAGGGIRYFIPASTPKDQKDYAGNTIKSKREDEKDVVASFENLGYETFIGKEGTDAFRTAEFEAGDQVLALFTYSHLPYEIDRVNEAPQIPSLAEMTETAIDLLEEDQDGFFLMVEGGRIDHAAHQNDAAAMVQDTLAFDAAVEEAMAFYQAHPSETLVLVVGDHETGGLGLGMDTKGYFVDPSQLGKATASIADKLAYSDLAYNGDRTAYYKTLETELGLNDLTADEKAKLEAAMDAQDAGETFGYYKYDPAPVAVAHLVSERANIFWTTTIHTGTAIPLSAQGVEAEKFLGYKDNTEIAKTLAEIMNVSFAK